MLEMKVKMEIKTIFWQISQKYSPIILWINVAPKTVSWAVEMHLKIDYCFKSIPVTTINDFKKDLKLKPLYPMFHFLLQIMK